mgnify:CR=1 FL=1
MSEPVVGRTDMVGKCEGLGLLAKRLFVVFTTPTNGFGPVMKNLENHLDFHEYSKTRASCLVPAPSPTMLSPIGTEKAWSLSAPPLLGLSLIHI